MPSTRQLTITHCSQLWRMETFNTRSRQICKARVCLFLRVGTRQKELASPSGLFYIKILTASVRSPPSPIHPKYSLPHSCIAQAGLRLTQFSSARSGNKQPHPHYHLGIRFQPWRLMCNLGTNRPQCFPDSVVTTSMSFLRHGAKALIVYLYST